MNRWRALEKDEGEDWDLPSMCILEEVGELMEMDVDQDDFSKRGMRKITAVVDSGASVSVLPEDWLPEIPLEASKGSVEGKRYRAAGGKSIPNLGQKRVSAVTKEGHHKTMTWQVCPVRRALISVSKMVEAGNTVTMGSEDPKIVNDATGQTTRMQKKGGVYTVDMWVKVRPTAAAASNRRTARHRWDKEDVKMSGFTRQEN